MIGCWGFSLALTMIVYSPVAFVIKKLGLFTPKSVRVSERAKREGSYTTGRLVSPFCYGQHWVIYEYMVDGQRYIKEFINSGGVSPDELTVYWKAGRPDKAYVDIEVVDGFAARFFTLAPIVLWLSGGIFLEIALKRYLGL